MNAADLTPFLLLLFLGLTFGVGIAMTILLHKRRTPIRRLRKLPARPPLPFEFSASIPAFANRPSRWVAVKSQNLAEVQTALGLHNPKPCSLQKGLSGEEKLFIAPPIGGWILVFGSELPDPSEDADVCFHFVSGLSRKLGQVQLFSASRVLYHHAWVRADSGKIQRAYAWANETVWKQGPRTAAERALDLACFDYGVSFERGSWTIPDVIMSNVEKVHLLASRWSLDPAALDESFLGQEQGVAGEK